MRRISQLAAGLLLVVYLTQNLTISPSVASTSAGELILLSTAPDRIPANNSSSWPTMSAGGQLVAFTSQASNLQTGDQNSVSDVFLHDRQTGSLDAITVTSEGVLGNGASYQPAITADGRVIVFASLASNLAAGDTNGLSDIYIHDKNDGTTERISMTPEGTQPNGWSDQPTISGNGRYITFRSAADNLVANDNNRADDVFLYDQETARLLRVSTAVGNSSNPFISSDGRYIGYLSQSSNSPELWIYDGLTQKSRRIDPPESKLPGHYTFGPPVLSADGQYIAFSVERNRSVIIYLYDYLNQKLRSIGTRKITGNNDAFAMKLSISADGRWVAYESETGISLFDKNTGKTEQLQIDQASAPLPTDLRWPVISLDGRSLAFIAQTNSLTNVYTVEINQNESSSGLVAGWVSDGLGHPLTGVTILAGMDRQARTAPDGSFFFQGISSRSITLTPEMKGYSFYPASRTMTDSPGGVVGLKFVGVPEGIVEEAFKDIGMPYSRFRGCESPDQECSGTFHGFYAGECTDLVMDAYNAGVDFNIQAALERDYRANPRHYYQWRDARNSHDMWRYFKYTGQVLPAAEPYLPGDIVFFDWEEDGVVDHVAVISEVNSKGRPRKMIDATGVVADNPAGLAIELNWKPYHAARTPGHARWLGYSTRKDNNAPQDIPILLVALDAPGIDLRLSDSHGRVTTEATFQIPGSGYISTGLGQVFSIDQPEVSEGWFFIELTASKDVPYQLGIQTIDLKEISASRVYQRKITAGETQLIPLQLKTVDGKLKFDIPIPLP